MSDGVKLWGKNPFWGLGFDFDPQWKLTEEMKELQRKLIELCRLKIKPHAADCDEKYEFPKVALQSLHELGLMGLNVPTYLGGMGQNHVCAAMVVETVARYGCPSTALVYTMHLASVAALVAAHHDNPTAAELCRRICKEGIVGTLAYTDGATGGNVYVLPSSKWRQLDDGHIQLLKYSSWTTSAGFADWYLLLTLHPEHGGDYSKLTFFVVYKDEVRAHVGEWSAMGMHGNHSGPLIVEGVFTKDRMIGGEVNGYDHSEDTSIPYFHLLASCTYNGISMACLDLAKKHVTRKVLGNAGLRIGDYPIIQDYFGQCVTEATASRMTAYSVADKLDIKTDNCDWSKYKDPSFTLRSEEVVWLFQAQSMAVSTVEKVATSMLHATGGTGYRSQLGLERLVRDGLAGWLMAYSNEIMRSVIGKVVLFGPESMDFCDINVEHRVLNKELRKLSMEEKKLLASQLLEETKSTPEYGKEINFYDPFNTELPAYSDKLLTTADGLQHEAGLHPKEYRKVKLVELKMLNTDYCLLRFSLQSPSHHSGTLPGQYVQLRVTPTGKPPQERFFSPVSPPHRFGEIDLVLKLESHGLMSQYLTGLNKGDEVEIRGPCGGLEYHPNTVPQLVLLVGGAGVTPGLQIFRAVRDNPDDSTHVTIIYYGETIEDLLYREEIVAAAESDKRFRVVFSVGEAPPEGWDGEEGLLDAELLKRYLPESNEGKQKVIVCGSTTMMTSCLAELRQLGYKSRDIYIYGPFGVELLRKIYGQGAELASHRTG